MEVDPGVAGKDGTSESCSIRAGGGYPKQYESWERLKAIIKWYFDDGTDGGKYFAEVAVRKLTEVKMNALKSMARSLSPNRSGTAHISSVYSSTSHISSVDLLLISLQCTAASGNLRWIS